ncbi:MAG TPA: flagellar protein FlgN [Geobacteraceae bacterium]|nr:flagellar protein FlgN [Geobacteraceae bacterium]
MSNGIDLLAARLSVKQELLEKLVLLLDREREMIVQLNAAGIEEERGNKLVLIERLGRAKLDCKKALEDAVREVGLPHDATLSTLAATVPPRPGATLSATRKRLVELIDALNRSNRLNRDLLYGSLRMVNRSLEFYNNSLGGARTYSGAGRMVPGVAGGRLVSGEI